MSLSNQHFVDFDTCALDACSGFLNSCASSQYEGPGYLRILGHKSPIESSLAKLRSAKESDQTVNMVAVGVGCWRGVLAWGVGVGCYFIGWSSSYFFDYSKLFTLSNTLGLSVFS